MMEYTLINNDLQVGFTSKGASLTSVKSKGMEYLWQGDPDYWSGQSPVLFPICGSLRGDRAVTEDGKELKMPRHGIVRKEEFGLESFEGDRISFFIESDERMGSMYPYRFRLSVAYELEARSVRVIYRVLNMDRVPMPFFIGGHPAFNCPLKEGEAYSRYQLVFETAEDCTVPAPVTETGLIDMENRMPGLDNSGVLPLSHSLFHKDAIIFDRLQSRSVTLVHKDQGHGLQLDFEDFPYLILWSSPNDGPFIAIEPWSGLSTCSDEDDILEHKRNVTIAEPGEVKEFSYRIRVLEP